MTQMPHHCPSCNHDMVVTQLSCTNCETAVVGHYPLSPFSQLSEKSLNFLEVFIRSRGNVKEMERETGQSYWAIRNRLDKVIAEMGFDVPDESASISERRKDILAQLKEDKIDVAEATHLLKELGD